MDKSSEEYITDIFEKVAEVRFENSDAPKVLEKLVGDCKYWGCDMNMKEEDDYAKVIVYLTVPKNSELMEDIDGDGHYRNMSGENAAKLVKKRIVEYFSMIQKFFWGSNPKVIVKYKINPYIDTWTLEQADNALKHYNDALKNYNEKVENIN